MSAVSKYGRFDTAPGSTHNLVVSLVPRGARVLEFGCATGHMSEVLKTRLDCLVTGVELSPEAGRLAREHCQRVIIGDAESLDFGELFGDAQFDAILFADVLEHLREPGALLARVRPLLAERGAVIASIPNIAHGSVRLALLNGEFRYREVGLLDSTHLRFFTRETIQDLFEGNGYAVTHWLRRREDIGRTELGPPLRRVPEPVLEWLTADPEATTYQFIVRAVRAEPAETIAQLREELAAVTADHAWLRRVLLAAHDLAPLIPPAEASIVVDEAQLGSEVVPGRRGIPFLERHGQYWGPPPDDETAIRELERLRHDGASFMVIAWPAFWWLDHYARFHDYLHSNFRCVLKNEHLIVFDLRA